MKSLLSKVNSKRTACTYVLVLIRLLIGVKASAFKTRPVGRPGHFQKKGAQKLSRTMLKKLAQNMILGKFSVWVSFFIAIKLIPLHSSKYKNARINFIPAKKFSDKADIALKMNIHVWPGGLAFADELFDSNNNNGNAYYNSSPSSSPQPRNTNNRNNNNFY